MKTISNAFAKGTLATVAAGAMALASASPAMAQDRYRDRDGGISAGEIIAGALVIGGIAAVASSIGKDRNYRGTYGEPYYNGNYNSRYGYNNYGNPRQAVEQCVRAAQRGAYGARVTDIRDVDRKNYGGGWGRDYNYRYSGRNYDQGRFTCDVQGNRVVGLDYSGLRGYR
jgi:hypothetical protein